LEIVFQKYCNSKNNCLQNYGADIYPIGKFFNKRYEDVFIEYATFLVEHNYNSTNKIIYQSIIIIIYSPSFQ